MRHSDNLCYWNSYNGVAEILKGLSVGDKIISVGYQELVDGEYVRY